MDQNKPELSLVDRLSVFLATGCAAGFLPTFLFRLSHSPGRKTLEEKKLTGAGLLGSFEGALTFLLLPQVVAQSWIALMTAILISIGVSGRAEKALHSHDDSRIIIDEWVGAWIAMWGLDQRIGWPVIIAFILFRLFDVVKGPIGHRLQRLPGGWGVIMDDVYAGVLANILCRLSIGYLPPTYHCLLF